MRVGWLHRALAHRSSRGFSTSRRRSPTMLMLKTRSDQQKARIDADPVLARHQHLVAVGDEEARGTAR